MSTETISLLTSFSKIFEKGMQTRTTGTFHKIQYFNQGTVWIQNKINNRKCCI
jgi:hypothetical protein